MSQETTEKGTTVKLINLYTTRITKVDTGKNTWSVLNVEILLNEDGKDPVVIGSYKRNYSLMYRTFLPFEKNGKHYALYSKDYQTTSVMSLPDCKHLASTNDFAFCPVDYFVPDFEEFHQGLDYMQKSVDDGSDKYGNCAAYLKHSEGQKKWIGTRALVSGCVWGDDSGGWKVCMLDLSEIEIGVIKHDGALGYFQLPSNAGPLSECVLWDEPDELSLPVEMKFDLDKGSFSAYPLMDLTLRHWEGYEMELKKKEGHTT